MEWTVVGVIVVLVGLYGAMLKPVISLNKNLTELNVNLSALKEAQVNDRKSNCDEHRELKAKDAEQDKVLADHETRITLVERAK